MMIIAMEVDPKNIENYLPYHLNLTPRLLFVSSYVPQVLDALVLNYTFHKSVQIISH
jgi:hypothetical protein